MNCPQTIAIRSTSAPSIAGRELRADREMDPAKVTLPRETTLAFKAVEGADFGSPLGFWLK